ncbi:GDP-fucose transporter 1 [Aplysia californica]|uniref:GDP-fucose transporter 1 n=1 Tax=Aplysia californica TaxID=6500 RepID=A0ABM0JYT6_APLCA|nr:GDP-fucose transporter 1 [Aplysia californica]
MAVSNVLSIVAVVISHWSISMAMVFVNKRLVGSKDSGLDIAVFIVWVQNLVGALIMSLAMKINGSLELSWKTPRFCIAELTHPDMVLSSMTFAGTLVFNNLMLKYISVAFYQVARSLTLIFVISFSAFILKEKFTTHVLLSCALIVLGFYVAVDEEIISQGVQMIGVVYGILASLFAALCGVFFKRFQTGMKVTSMQLTYNNCVICAVTLFPLVISTGQLSSFLSSRFGSDAVTWGLLVVSGIMSLTMGWISALQIRLTSPLSHNISINAKSLCQTMLAVSWSGQSRHWLWWLGNGLVMTGIGVYTANKIRLESSRQNRNIEVEVKEPKQED